MITERQALQSIIAICIGALLAAYIAEQFFNIKPCALCYWQRYAYMATGFLAGIFLLKRAPIGILFSGLLFDVNGLIALYQVMIEKHLIPAPAFCKKVGEGAMTLDQLREQFAQQTEIVACDTVSWELFGFSLAAYNAGFCFVVGGLCIAVYGYFRRRKS